MPQNNIEIEHGTVARYCKPSALDENNHPTSAAFQRRQYRNEEYLSVYLLDFFDNLDAEKKRIQATKAEMERKGWRCSQHSVFATLDILHTITYIHEEIAEHVQFEEAGLPHCGIFHDADDLLIAELLAECVESAHLTSNFV